LQALYHAEQEGVRTFLADRKISELISVAAWRQAYKQFGVDPHKFSPSIERLLKRVQKGDLSPINPLVDLYNLISIRSLFPAGGNDLDSVVGDILLRVASAKEIPIKLIQEDKSEAPVSGEVIYADQEGAICRRWNWKQDDRTKITPDTRNAIFFVESLPLQSADELKNAITALTLYITTHCGGVAYSGIVDREHMSAIIDNMGIEVIPSQNKLSMASQTIPTQGMSQEKLSEQYEVRVKKTESLRSSGIDPWPATMSAEPISIATVRNKFAEQKNEAEYVIAGRLLTIRKHGKTVFADCVDMSGALQLYIKKGGISDEQFQFFDSFIDVGDILLARGTLFETKTGELTLLVQYFSLLSKSLHPLPEKFHGLVDTETKYRQRYLDLITNIESKDRFLKRSFIIRIMRKFFDERGYCEVETPMLHPIPGGALARPFMTHHNALDMELYLRIAPELYLKRLVVGGIERVYEINRNFRNEGVSTRHNPEFTMVEFYTAYAQFDHIIKFVEEMIASVAHQVCGDTTVFFGEQKLNFSAPFAQITMLDAVAAACSVTTDTLSSDHGIREIGKKNGVICPQGASWGTCLTLLFEELVEKKLVQPTFITQFPVEVSPLAKRSPVDPRFVDRFELFAGGMELANGYNELNDPFEQAARFKEQLVSQGGTDDTHRFDADYVRALEYALPPTIGVGIGIDRLTMFLTNAHTIRDVILFPTLRRKE
jgi:lysyl-tRNA synthetase class 2